MKKKRLNLANLSHTADHPCRIIIIGGSGCGKTNSLFNLINHQPDIDKIKDPYEAKYQFLIKKREDVGTNYFSDPKISIEYSNYINDICKNIEEYNPKKPVKYQSVLMI